MVESVQANTDCVIGIDVGTGSARAGIFSLSGEKRAAAVTPITTWRPRPHYMQQSSEEIWNAVCRSVREALASIGEAVTIRGLGFDATCSLMVAGRGGTPLSVDPDGAPGQDIILWADHRATAEAEAINAAGHSVLRYVGGTISPEMETPKLLWLKRHLPDVYAAAAQFFDLPDFLTWRATGATSRSTCSTSCKWTYLAHENRWDPAYFRQIGLDDLADEDFTRIGTQVLPLGKAVPSGLSERAAEELGLRPGIPVAVSAIDAHAGGIGILGPAFAQGEGVAERSLALICGTSSCHMAIAREPRFVPGVWGPYFEAMLPGFWLNEAGQSATGAALDHLIKMHPAASKLEGGAPAPIQLNAVLNELEANKPPGTASTEVHVLPDFNGNRSPHADPHTRGTISGLTLSESIESLATLYLAGMQGLAYGTGEIIRALNADGYAIDTLYATGGLSKNPVFLREHANATGCRIVLPKEEDSVLLGAAILAATAAGVYPQLSEAMSAMSRAGLTIEPDATVAGFHAAKRAVFDAMRRDQNQYRALMAAGNLPPQIV